MSSPVQESMPYEPQAAKHIEKKVYVNKGSGYIYGLTPAPGVSIDPQLWKGKPQTVRIPRRSHLSKDKLNTRTPKLSFVFMDIGAWGDDPLGDVVRCKANGDNHFNQEQWEKQFRKRNFGLVVGRQVWVCRFVQTGRPGWSALPPYEAHASEPEISTLKAFVAAIEAEGCSICVEHYATLQGAVFPHPQYIHIFLPDMHIPGFQYWDDFYELSPKEEWDLYVYTSVGGPRPYSERLDLLLRMYPKETLREHYDAYCLARSRDIFGDYAEDALKEFLDIINFMDEALRKKTIVIQTGDMYELWQGTGDMTGYLEKDSSGCTMDPDGRKPIWERINLIHRQHRVLFETFKMLENRIAKVVYLYGNHDVYLADALRKRDPDWGTYIQYLPSRQTQGYANGIWAEHGHRFDSSNVEGNWMGPFLTDAVYYYPKIRDYEDIARIIAGQEIDYPEVAAKHCYYMANFVTRGGKPTPVALFVMAHTHTANLLNVDLRVVYTEENPALYSPNM